ncbi:hypothetical protein MANES_09G111700v8 [Manihot esculenta]|uniref:Uncharacterized protein n=1 Tax=Manihot esculenta TaxID=3983 RepID=A0A2C9VC23_MANES|nr:hypothetical protein MANES_09G111700v8 [Manihot esculenta]
MLSCFWVQFVLGSDSLLFLMLGLSLLPKQNISVSLDFKKTALQRSRDTSSFKRVVANPQVPIQPRE